jgi:hypothetical protein
MFSRGRTKKNAVHATVNQKIKGQITTLTPFTTHHSLGNSFVEPDGAHEIGRDYVFDIL